MSEQSKLDELAETTGKSSSQSWSDTNLGEVVSITGGKAFSSDQYVDNGVPLIRITNIGQGTPTGEDLKYLPESLLENVDSKFILKEDDILMALSGATTGKVSRLPSKYTPALLNQRIAKFNTSGELNHHFLLFCLQSHNFQRYVDAFASGGAQDNISTYDLERISIPQPPVSEQRKIATVLYTVDRAIEKTEEIIEQTKTAEKGLMQDLFREGIDKPETKELRRVGQVPKHWDVVKLGDVCERITDGTHKSPPTIEEGYPYITSQNVRNWGFDLSDLKYISEEDHNRITSRCNPEEGDVLYVKDGANTGNVNVNTLDFEFSLLSSVALIKPNRDRVKPWFLKYLLSWPKFRDLVLSQMSGTGIRRLTISKLEKTDVLLPPMEEQEYLIEVLDEYYTYRKNQNENKNHLQRLKRGLMQDLLSGTVRTTDTNIEVPEEIAQYG